MVAERFEVAQPLGVRARRRARAPRPTRSCSSVRRAQQEVLIDHLVHERVGEPVALAPRAQCPAGWSRSASTRRSSAAPAARRVRRDGAQERLVEGRPEHGAPPGAGAARSAGSRSTRGEQQPVERWTARPPPRTPPVHAQRSPSRTSTPLPTRLRNDLLDEERIAAGPVGDEVLELRRARRRATAPNSPLDQRARLLRRERAEPDDRLRRARHCAGGALRPMREQEHQRPVRQVIDARGAAGPTEAVSAQCRSSTTMSSGPCCRRRSISVRAASAIWRWSCSGSMSRAVPPPPRARSSAPARWPPPPRPARPAPGARRSASRRATSSESAGSDLVRLPEERAEDAVRRLAQRGAGGAAHGGAGEPAVGVGAQARQSSAMSRDLPVPASPDHAHDLRAALPHRARTRP